MNEHQDLRVAPDTVVRNSVQPAAQIVSAQIIELVRKVIGPVSRFA